MKPTQARRAIEHAFEANLPCFVWGAPGVGKSQVVRQIADDMGMPMVDVRAVLLDPVDLRGLPHVNGDNQAHWCPPAFLPSDGQGVLFLDELNAAPPLVQAACYQLVLDRQLGEYELPEGWRIIAAGNRGTDHAVTHRMPTPLASRFMHIEFSVELDDWKDWAASNDVPFEILGYLNHRPENLHNFSPASNEKAFPCPRTWEMLGRLMKTEPGSDIVHSLYSGIIGEAVATEFIGFLEIAHKLPNAVDIIANPQLGIVPDQVSVIYALCAAMAYRCTPENFGNICAYSERMAQEFNVTLIMDCLRSCPAIQETAAFRDWAIKNQNVLMA